MNQRIQSDIIAAQATPIGEGGLSIIRLSGPGSIGLVDKIFSGTNSLASAQSHTIHHGILIDRLGQQIDDVLISVFHNPHSYTGEDSVEISCHGGMLIAQNILEAVIAIGARLANPGEFTHRAFLNGKMDLAQAEAVADMIHATSERARRTALEQLNGKLSAYIEKLRKELLDLCALLELELDFTEEDVVLAGKGQIKDKINRLMEQIGEIRDSYRIGRIYRDGIRVVLTGKPNSGKSSLLNILLAENRAIVSELPGTTRDVIEEDVTIGGLLFRLIDTAGIREAFDMIEHEGVRRAKQKIETADIVVILIDATTEDIVGDIQQILSDIPAIESDRSRHLMILNKIDIAGPSALTVKDHRDLFSASISCKTHAGIDSFRSKLLEIAIPQQSTGTTSVVVQNIRHKGALDNAFSDLSKALISLEVGRGNEFISFDLRAAVDHLGEIIGVVTSEDILNNIFSRFCIGK